MTTQARLIQVLILKRNLGICNLIQIPHIKLHRQKTDLYTGCIISNSTRTMPVVYKIQLEFNISLSEKKKASLNSARRPTNGFDGNYNVLE
jgi:hypothetical protein